MPIKDREKRLAYRRRYRLKNIEKARKQGTEQQRRHFAKHPRKHVSAEERQLKLFGTIIRKNGWNQLLKLSH